MKRLLVLLTAAVALPAASASAAPIVSNWSDVGSSTAIPAGYTKVQIADFSGGGLADEVLSGPGVPPAVVVDSYLGDTNSLMTLNQMQAPINGVAGKGGYTAVGDLNGDGVVDLVSAQGTPSAVRWLLSTGVRSPTRPRYTLKGFSDPGNTFGTALDVALADADGDGDLDAFVDFDGRLGIMKNDGAGNLATPVIQGPTAGFSGGDRIGLASLASPGKYPGGAFVPPTVFLSAHPDLNTGSAGGTRAYVPAGGQTYSTVTLPATVPPAAVSPTQLLSSVVKSNTSVTSQLTTFDGNAFTQLSPFPAVTNFTPSRNQSCSRRAVGDQLNNIVTKTFAIGGVSQSSASGVPVSVGKVALFGQPSGETAIREVRDITLTPNSEVCDMAMGPLGLTEGGVASDLVVLASSTSTTAPNQLFIFHGLAAASGFAAAPAPGGGPARLVGRTAKVSRTGTVALRFACPKRAGSACRLHASLTPSVGTVAPYVISVRVRPGRKHTSTVRLSPDAAAAARHGGVGLALRAVENGKPLARIKVR